MELVCDAHLRLPRQSTDVGEPKDERPSRKINVRSNDVPNCVATTGSNCSTIVHLTVTGVATPVSLGLIDDGGRAGRRWRPVDIGLAQTLGMDYARSINEAGST